MKDRIAVSSSPASPVQDHILSPCFWGVCGEEVMIDHVVGERSRPAPSPISAFVGASKPCWGNTRR